MHGVCTLLWSCAEAVPVRTPCAFRAPRRAARRPRAGPPAAGRPASRVVATCFYFILYVVVFTSYFGTKSERISKNLKSDNKDRWLLGGRNMPRTRHRHRRPRVKVSRQLT